MTSARRCALASFILALGAATGAAPASSLPDGWEVQSFAGKLPTAYRLVDDGAGAQVLQADCKASASGLIRRQQVDLARTPILRWRWRTGHVYAGLDERTRAGDDFPLRVYVVDRRWPWWNTRLLVYVWSSVAADATPRPGPYTDRAVVIALRGPGSGVGQWRDERRDVRDDFAAAFGAAPDSVDGVALMTDCDDSGRSVRAWYGDIRWSAE